jgi:hypothetical protein
MSISKAIQALPDQYPGKWDNYEDLDKRYFEAKKAWSSGRELQALVDRWHPDYPENSR